VARFGPVEELFKGQHFEQEIVVLCVRWYLSFKLSYRDLVSRMARKLTHQQRRAHRVLAERSNQPRDVVPVFADCTQMNAAAEERLEAVILRGLIEAEDAVIGQIPNPRCKAKAKHITQSEDMVGVARSVGIVLIDLEVGLMIEQTIQNHARRSAVYFSVASAILVLPRLVAAANTAVSSPAL
jgi:hypothetical protein